MSQFDKLANGAIFRFPSSDAPYVKLGPLAYGSLTASSSIRPLRLRNCDVYEIYKTNIANKSQTVIPVRDDEALLDARDMAAEIGKMDH